MAQRQQPIDHLVVQTFCYAFYPLLNLGAIGWVILGGPSTQKPNVLMAVNCFYVLAAFLTYFMPEEGDGIKPLSISSSILWPVTFLRMAYIGVKQIVQRFHQHCRHAISP